MRQSRNLNRVRSLFFASGQRWSRRSTRPCSAPRLERLEDRTLLSAGDLDPTFGIGGKLTTGFQGPLDSQAQAATLQADSKIVVVGAVTEFLIGGFGVARFNSDGSLDTTFGKGGTVITTFEPAATNVDHASAVAIQSDGRIVVAGVAASGVALARYNTDGSLDPSFAGSGKVTTQVNANPVGIALQPDQKIVVVATTGPNGGSFVLTRFNSDGSLDTTFGTGGSLSSTLGSAAGVVVEVDGRIIVAAATSLNSQTNNAFVVAAYNPDGSSVATFGNGGVVTTIFGPGNSDVAEAIVLQSDAKFVVAGRTAGGQAYARYNEDGSLDATFGSGGKTTVSDSGSDITGLALQGDGKIVAAVTETIQVSTTVSVFHSMTRLTPVGPLDPAFGTQGRINTTRAAKSLLVQTSGRIVLASTAGASPTQQFALDGFTATGSVDATFGTSGEATAAVIGMVPARVVGVLVQSDGRTVVAGTGPSALIRYNVDGSLDASFGKGGSVSTPFGQGDFVAGETMQPDGKILLVGGGRGRLDLARYNADGSLDVSFGTGGTAITTLSDNPPAPIFPNPIALEPDGKMVVAFERTSPGGIPGIMRFNPDGSLDSSFAATIPMLLPNASIYGVAEPAIQRDGRIILRVSAGGAPNAINESKNALIRLNLDGSLDPLFGTGRHPGNRSCRQRAPPGRWPDPYGGIYPNSARCANRLRDGPLLGERKSGHDFRHRRKGDRHLWRQHTVGLRLAARWQGPRRRPDRQPRFRTDAL
jgi:uncharacterized delta-60 repeat protein